MPLGDSVEGFFSQDFDPGFVVQFVVSNQPMINYGEP